MIHRWFELVTAGVFYEIGLEIHKYSCIIGIQKPVEANICLWNLLWNGCIFR